MESGRTTVPSALNPPSPASFPRGIEHRSRGVGGPIQTASGCSTSLVPTHPNRAVVWELGPAVGCRVLSVDHQGDAVCLRDPETPAERLDMVPVEEILKLVEARYEQRRAPREP